MTAPPGRRSPGAAISRATATSGLQAVERNAYGREITGGRSAVRTRADQLAVLLDPELDSSRALGWHLQHGPVLELVQRLDRLTGEVAGMGGRREVDLPAYLTAIHALVLDLVELTGAPTNGRRHPAHDALLEHFGLSRGPL